MALEAIISVFVELIKTPIAEYVVTPMKRHLSYAFQCDSKVKNLEEAVVELKNKKARLEQSVDQAKRNGEEIYENVTSWLSSARNDIGEADELIRGKEDAKKECCVGVCPNLKTRYQLSKKSDSKASEISKLVQDAEGLNPIAFCPALEQIVEPSVFAREALSSRLEILDQIMDALKDPQLNVIGVYGMGGVGKTTLAKEVQAKATQEKMFESVVLVAVSQTPEVKRIQAEIAELLGMRFDVEQVPARASRLYERLRKSKVLIILDDLWDELDINAIGIPSGDSLKGCKLLLTSRSMDVLRIKMQTQKEFPLGVLGDKEAWTLFQTMAPKSIDVQFHDIATKVAKKCAGLPLLIIIVAKELQKKELYAWNDMLKKLSVFGDEDIHQRVHKVLESSFNNLPEGEVRSLFLLCSLFAQSNIQIQCLLIYCMGLGLFKHIDTVQEARNRLLTLISKLKAECLLLDGDMGGFVKMHDVVRDAAISIASRSQHAFVGAGQVRLMDELDQKCTKISLPYCNVSELPGGLVCPEVDLFLLFTEDLCLEIPRSFFEGIRKLKAVGFTGMRFVSLPSSLGLLANLHTLSFHYCQLNNVAVIGELKQLEVLSFADSKIKELPREIEELTQLKLLDLSNCTRLRVIPVNVFSKLCLLEELYMLSSFRQWDTKGNASLMELENLSQLSTLEIQIGSPKLIPEGFRFFDGLKLQRFKISVGSEWDWDEKYETSKTLKVKLDSGIRLEHGIAMLLREAEDLYVDEVRGINLDGERFPHLKHLHIESDSGSIQHLVKASGQAFAILESLHLNKLRSLESICNGQLASGSFGKLQKLSVRTCLKLENVLSFSTAKCMYQLREMEFYSCDTVEAIVGDGTEDGHYTNEVIEFTQLNSLYLRKLSNLRCFCKKEVGKPQIDSLFNEMVSFPNLASLAVSDCKSLKYIFTSSVVECLVQLKKLQIQWCDSVEEIVLVKKFEEIEEDSIDKIAFPKLDYLDISELPNLKRFCRGHVIDFPSLKTLYLSSCRAMQNFVSSSSNNNGSDDYFFNEMVALSNLETMDVRGMDNLRYLWDEKAIVKDSFFKLKSLTIRICSKLLFIFPSNLYGIFLKLETLDVSNCDGVEEIYQYEGVDSDGENIEAAFSLRDLRIWDLQSLKYIWSKESCRAATFKSLQSVYVDRCWNLKYVFPKSIACDLVQLQQLVIKYCSVETVIAKKSENGPSSLEFPELTFLQLVASNELRCLYEGMHTLQLPKLKSLEVRSCPKIMNLGTEISCHSEDQNEKDSLSHPLPQFSAQKLLLGVEKLTIDSHGFKLIAGGALPNEFFSRVKTVTVYSIEEESIRFLFGFLNRLCSIEKLVFHGGSLEEISLFNDGDEQAAGEQPHYQRLKHLEFEHLSELKNIIKKGSQLNHVLQYLQALTIENCYVLTDVALHSTSFQNLTTLHLFCCYSLTKLVTFSTAKTMVQLMRMKVEEGYWMEEIIADDSTSTEYNVINFSKLECLELIDLLSINSFCSGNHAFIFPSLEKVTVKNCSKMKNFCGGDLSTPKLRGVLLDGEQQWEGDLNITISSHLRSWVGGRFEEGRRFQNVQSLEVVKDAFSSNAILANQLQFLNKLKKIVVRECDLVQVVFDLEGLSIEDGHFGFLPKLEELHLVNLPMLSKLCNRPPVGVLDFNKLRVLKIENCGKLVHAFTWSMASCLVQLQRIELRNCDLMERIIKEEVDDSRDTVMLRSLRFVVLECLPMFSGFYSGTGVLECPSLEEINIRECPSIKASFLRLPTKDRKGKKHYTHFRRNVRMEYSFCDMEALIIYTRARFLQLALDLEDVEVAECSTLKILLPPSAAFQNLTNLQVSKCDSLMNLMTSSTARSLVQLEKVVVEECKMIQEIIASGPDAGDYEIRFSQLECLKLDDLPCLECFFSGNNDFHFPALEEVVVIGCPKLKTFACSVTPKLKKVRTGRRNHEWKWEGNLNNTIQAIHAEKVADEMDAQNETTLIG